MKVSLSWIFDHIGSNWKKHDAAKIVARFNQVTAEIESFEKVSIDLSSVFAGKVKDVEKEHIVLSVDELGKEVELPHRPKSVKKGDYFLLASDKKTFKWATCKSVGLDKDGLLTEFFISDKDAKGDWKKSFECEDVIFDVDNKSLTHRPDMWGHRGFAREVAAFLELEFRDKKEFLDDTVQNMDSKIGPNKSFSVEIAAPKACLRFAGLHISSIENRPSDLFIASRLIKVGIRPINAIVDLTNYVMLDWSQPVHAYDANKIKDKKLIARMAKKGEKITLLDGKQLELDPQDLVIADSSKPVGLAGIMGGVGDSIETETNSVLFESAHFDSSCIRRTSLRHGIRTDSSSRFEKKLDPNQITDAVQRFVMLIKKLGIKHEINGNMICIGEPFKEKTIGVLHSFLEKRSGVKLKKDEVIESLTRLGFTVSCSPEKMEKDLLYTILIPSFRGAKDIEIKEDILEEVIRYFGFDNIALTLPAIKKMPHDSTPMFRMRKIKEFLVNSAKMTEQKNYFYYDEEFLKSVGLDFENCLQIKNPVSENNVRLASSLLPNLFKNIMQNCPNENSLSFFEEGRICRIANESVIEEKNLAGIFFEKRKDVNFYFGKQVVTDFLKICGMEEVEWRRIDERYKSSPWIMPNQSAEIFFNQVKVGVAGKIDNAFLDKIGGLPESSAFFFDINLELLLSRMPEDKIYSPISKFQESTFDLCFMIPLSLTVSSLEGLLLDSNDFIKRVELIDFFENESWADKRSVAFRIWVDHPEKTLLKEEIEDVRNNALKVAKDMGASLRS